MTTKLDAQPALLHKFGGDWTAAKLACIEAYLSAYLTAMSKQDFELHYIDAFAGNGHCSIRPSRDEYGTELPDRDARALIDGSAKIALGMDGFDKYVFVEKNPEHVAELRTITDEYPNKQIQVHEGDANDFIRGICKGRPWFGKRAVMFSRGWDERINLDGFLRHSGVGGQTTRWGYVQLYRNGIIEACDSVLLGGNAAPAIPSLNLEGGLISGVSRFLRVQRELGVESPIVLMITIEGVKGVPLGVSNDPFFQMRSNTMDRDKLFLPEILIEDYSQNVDRILRPVFDGIYNSAGFESCPRYNGNGEYDSKLVR